MSIAWLNGEIGTELPLPAANAGWLSGHGVFTTIGIWGARPFALDLHLQRLRHDVQHAHIDYTLDEDQLTQAVAQIIDRNNISRGMARITVAQRGDGRWSQRSGADCLIVAQALTWDYLPPARVALSPYRIHSRRPLAGVKSTSYHDYTLAWQQAHAQGFDEAVLLNENGQVCELARSNVFWVVGGELYTPELSTGCLPGVARHLVLQWANDNGLKTNEVEAAPEVMVRADEMFLTSSVQGVRGVHHLSEHSREYEAGEVTKLLQACWEKAVVD